MKGYLTPRLMEAYLLETSFRAIGGAFLAGDRLLKKHGLLRSAQAKLPSYCRPSNISTQEDDLRPLKRRTALSPCIPSLPIIDHAFHIVSPGSKYQEHEYSQSKRHYDYGLGEVPLILGLLQASAALAALLSINISCMSTRHGPLFV